MAIEMFTDKTGYIKSFENVKLNSLEHFTNVGLIFSDSGAIIIDTGWGEKQAKAILRELESIGKKLVAIINTHTHLDHAGGNKYLIDKTGCKLYCTLYESLMVSGSEQMFHVVFSEMLLPLPDGLELMGTLKKTEPIIIEADSKLIIDGAELEIISLPGHSDGHIGVVHEDILFCGDAILDPKSMSSNKIMFMTNPMLERKTAERIMKTSYSIYLPAHGVPFNNPEISVKLLIGMLDNLEKHMLESATEPICLDDMIAYVANNVNLHLNSLPYYNVAKVALHTLANSCVLEGKLECVLNENILYYKTVKEGECTEKRKN